LTLRESGDTVAFTDATKAILAPSGGYLVGPVSGARMIAVYDSAGSLRKSFGTKGRGPGDFLEIDGMAFGPGDSLHIGDRRIGRTSVFTPDEFAFARATPVSVVDAAFDATVGGRFLGIGMTNTRGEGIRRYGLRHESWHGVVTPLGSSLAPDRVGARTAATEPRRFWIADSRAYSITLVAGDTIIRTLRRDVPWFPRDTIPRGTLGGRAFITKMSVDEAGRLWVLIRRPNPAWKEIQMDPKRPMVPGRMPPLTDVFKGVLEVLDAMTGALIASREVPADMMDFLRPGLLFQRTDADSTGALMLQIWHARLGPVR
jgi:hypothetical protein